MALPEGTVRQLTLLPDLDTPSDAVAGPRADQAVTDRVALAAPDPDLGLVDLRAAVALVEAGLASRIVLASFPAWPGLLWQAYELARDAHVIILPTVVHDGGRIDIVVAREEEAGGEPVPTDHRAEPLAPDARG